MSFPKPPNRYFLPDSLAKDAKFGSGISTGPAYNLLEYVKSTDITPEDAFPWKPKPTDHQDAFLREAKTVLKYTAASYMEVFCHWARTIAFGGQDVLEKPADMETLYQKALKEFGDLGEGGKNKKMVDKTKGFLHANEKFETIAKSCPRAVHVEWSGDGGGMLPGGEGLPAIKAHPVWNRSG